MSICHKFGCSTKTAKHQVGMVMVWVMQLISTFSGSGHISGVDEARQFNLVCRLNVKSTGITLVKVLQHGGAF